MKKFNPNSLLVVFAGLFLLVGLWGNCFDRLTASAETFASELKTGNLSAAYDFKANIDRISNDELQYRYMLMDIHSAKENVLGTRVIDKTETLVVKADNGMLLGNFNKEKNNETIVWEANRIETYKNIAEKNNAKYIYCSVPAKTFYGGYPQNVACFKKSNTDRLLSELSKRNIPYINLTESFAAEGFSETDIFFYTDHHWKPMAGFVATEMICKDLSARYDFSYDPNICNISNYRVATYPNHFLGSLGKKVGTYFTWHGADDFDLITPDFPTDLVETRPQNNFERSGSFEETLLYMGYMGKNHYKVNTYAVYSGGDFRLQIIKNNLNPNGAKVLLLRNSFSCVISPFLALQVGQLHVVDDRAGTYPSGEKIDVEAYIQNEDFDYVIEIK